MSKSYAGLWIRIKAFAADYLAISFYIIVVIGISLVVRSIYPNLMLTLFGSPLLGQATGFFIMTLPVTLYFTLLESSSHQATLGKRWQSLKVIRTDGKRLSRMRALGRTAHKFIPWELAHTCIWQLEFSSQESSPIITAGFILVWILIGVYVITLSMSSQKQSLYDQLANTCVVTS